MNAVPVACVRLLGGLACGLLAIPIACNDWRWVRRRRLGWFGYVLMTVAMCLLFAPIGWPHP